MVKVLFFASLKEQLGCDSIDINLANTPCSVADLKRQLIAEKPQWQQHFDNKSLLSAVNQDMVTAQALVNNGDEVAFFPPVTGG